MEYKYEKKEDTVWIFLPFYKDWWLYLYPVPTITTPPPYFHEHCLFPHK